MPFNAGIHKTRRIITKHPCTMSEGRPAPTASPLAAASIRAHQGMWLVGLVAGVAVLLACAGEPARLALRYERLAVLDHAQLWRLVTGHLVHAGPAHLLLNMAGLGLIAALFPRDYSVRQWLIVLVASIATIDAGFVLFEPQLQWYVGLSGVLHGALAAGAIAWWRHESRVLALALIAILMLKLGWEQWQGALPFSGDMTVIVAAHLYGAIGGAAAGLLIWQISRRWPAEPASL